MRRTRLFASRIAWSAWRRRSKADPERLNQNLHGRPSADLGCRARLGITKLAQMTDYDCDVRCRESGASALDYEIGSPAAIGATSLAAGTSMINVQPLPGRLRT